MLVSSLYYNNPYVMGTKDYVNTCSTLRSKKLLIY